MTRRRGGPAAQSPPRPRRCAVYTRKSTTIGLEQEFNSLDAQREACEQYIASQAHAGWRLVPEHYDDGGFTGANLHRPGFERLMEDVHAGRVDVVVVYKVDRLSRSLLDFARVMEVFERHEVSFVSITQQFNTATSMGRLVLNVLLSFAQFEREMIGERTRDKIAASRRRGRWTGGPVPVGYDVVDKKLVVNELEAVVVGEIFDLYERHRSALKEQRKPLLIRRKELPAEIAKLSAEGQKLVDALDRTKGGARRLVEDRAETIAQEMAARERETRARVTQLLDLTLLAPDIQEQLLFMQAVDGQEPVSERRLRAVVKERSWKKQRRVWRGVRKGGVVRRKTCRGS